MYQQTTSHLAIAKDDFYTAVSSNPQSIQRGREKRKKGEVATTHNAYMLELFDRLGQMAVAQATVLIQGESGTGKEVFARMLHQKSTRCGRSFVRLNCAALPEGLLESELFGHEKGAFTGATRQRAGRFELADRGTLFLDEVGAANVKVQQRLLRVLQEQEFERVGGTQTLKVDVRVIAATNADLQEEMKRGNFRQDLFYRLEVVPVWLPPLRQRREDIPLLVDCFVQRAAGKNGKGVEGIEAQALERLQAYPWPGNIRQLENVVERMVIFADGQQLTVDDIPLEILEWKEQKELAELEDGSFQKAKALFERSFLCASLRRHKGVIAQVAEAIGMSRKNLYTKLEHLGIDYEYYRR